VILSSGLSFAFFVDGFDLKSNNKKSEKKAGASQTDSTWKDSVHTKANISFKNDLSLVPELIIRRGTLRVGFEPGYLPFEMTDQKGNVIGFDIDFGKALAKSMGVKFVGVNTIWGGIIPALITDKFDVIISGMAITKDRSLSINFSEPYIITGQAVLLNKNLEGIVKSYKDLNDSRYTIVSKLGTVGEQACTRMIPRANYKSFETESEAAREVLYGKADAVIYDLSYLAIFMAKKGRGKMIFLDKPFIHEPIGMAIKKGNPDFLKYLNTFIQQHKANGLWQKSYNKWFKNPDWINEI